MKMNAARIHELAAFTVELDVSIMSVASTFSLLSLFIVSPIFRLLESTGIISIPETDGLASDVADGDFILTWVAAGVLL